MSDDAARRLGFGGWRLAQAGALALGLLLVGCSSGGGGAEVEGLPVIPAGRSDAEVIALLRARSRRLDALSGVIGMNYSSSERSGTFDAVCLYRAPRELRLQAYKDLVVDSKDLFDLLLTPQGYALDHDFEDEPVRARGELSAFPAEQPRFAGMFWTGEALFLPGAADPARPIEVLARRADAIRVQTWLYSGARAEWDLDPQTLRVSRGFVSRPPLRVQLDYSDWDGVGALLELPSQVRYREGDTEITVRVSELDPDPEFVAEAFTAR